MLKNIIRKFQTDMPLITQAQESRAKIESHERKLTDPHSQWEILT